MVAFIPFHHNWPAGTTCTTENSYRDLLDAIGATFRDAGGHSLEFIALLDESVERTFNGLAAWIESLSRGWRPCSKPKLRPLGRMIVFSVSMQQNRFPGNWYLNCLHQTSDKKVMLF